ncbi:MAG TPA: phosphoribosylformylglycinamidine synthase subunit PurQ [Dehalococcoidia bacterium]|nr:phosphoribosylformylglycinamidine synthase subunit PurQ [Dehalococcoidia bacterium]
MKFGIIVFPGTWSERDCHHAIGTVLHQDVSYIWHKDTDLSGLDAVILPGGFSYGDYLRPGAVARFSPVMRAVAGFAAKGKYVFGICNGFQILCEAGLLPGALLSNNHLEFRCQWVNLRVENNKLGFTNQCRQGQVLRIPISHYDGNYYADEATLQTLEEDGRVAFRYCDPQGEPGPQSNPNGSLHNIAGIVNKQGNVLGMMPHPERACEELLGGPDGILLFQSLVESGACA